jgi:tRNA-dihydrouridine synthase
MVRETGCDAVMIGRTAASNPWIFRQIAEYLETGAYFIPTEQDRYEMMRKYYSIVADRNEPDAIGKMKQFATLFTHGVRNGAQLRSAIHGSKEIHEILDRVDAFFDRELVAVPA